MKLHEQLNEALKSAMKENDTNIKNYTRNVKSKLAEYCVANMIDRSNLVDDNIIITVITSYKKSLEKAIELLSNNKMGGNLIDEYNKEIDFLSKFLPKQEDMEKEIINTINTILEQSSINDPKQTGKVMGLVMKSFKEMNKVVDGALVKKIVVEELNRRNNGA